MFILTLISYNKNIIFNIDFYLITSNKKLSANNTRKWNFIRHSVNYLIFVCFIFKVKTEFKFFANPFFYVLLIFSTNATKCKINYKKLYFFLFVSLYSFSLRLFLFLDESIHFYVKYYGWIELDFWSWSIINLRIIFHCISSTTKIYR